MIGAVNSTGNGTADRGGTTNLAVASPAMRNLAL